MNFPKYWAKGIGREIEIDGRSVVFVCWRWSDKSLDDARTLAQEAAARLAEESEKSGQLPQRYGYGDRPLREPVLREIKNANGDLSAVVTRNSYGCQVLNTARVLFLDVDFSEKLEKPGFLARLFGGGSAKSDPMSKLLALVEKWMRQNPEWGLRVYRTKAGARLMATHDVFDPVQVGNDPAWMSNWGVDPLYLRLCRVQKCFRARLTPKFWRCNVDKPPVRWPFENTAAETAFKDWQRRYENASRSFSVCRLLNTYGNTRLHPEVEPVLRLHDEATGALGTLPLA